MLEEHRLDVELVRLELVEDQLGIVGAVVVADAGVVAADDEVRAAVVLAADRVPDRLAWPRVAHRRGERAQHDAFRRVVAAEQHAVALDSRLRGYVVGLRVADERVDQQPVDRFERDLRQIFVRAVDRVARLEAHDTFPATLGKRRARLSRVERELGERCCGALEDGDGAGEVEGLLLVQARDTGVRGVRRPERLLRLALLVVLEDVFDLEHGIRLAGCVDESDAVVPGRLRDRKAHGQRPRESARETHGLEDRLVVLAAHEARERGKRTAGQHVQAGELPRGQREGLERLEVGRPLARAVDELAAVRRDQRRFGGDAHAGTAAGINPRRSSSLTMRSALSCGSSCSDSMRISGSSGASYGSETPVNSLISPRNALSYRPLTSRRAHSSTEASTKTSTNVPLASTISRACSRASR